MVGMRMSLLLALGLSTLIRADEWASPQIREVFSQSRDYFVRVLPGNSWGDTVGFGGSPKGSYALPNSTGEKPIGLIVSRRRSA
jgi:hypothetical protein